MFPSPAHAARRASDLSSQAAFSTADLFDAFMDDAGANLRVCRPGLISYGGNPSYSGRVATVRGKGGIPMRLRDILDEAGEGRVLVADGLACEDWALLGDKMAALAEARGWAGVILNACVRDVSALRTIPVGVHALGSVPARPKWPSAPEYEREGVLTFLNCAFTPGSWVYADEDGILLADRCLLPVLSA